MEKIIIVHGDYAKDANDRTRLAELTHEAIHPVGCTRQCVKIVPWQPALFQKIENYIEKDTKRLTIHPFFLSTETQRELCAEIEQHKGQYHHIEFIYTEAGNFHKKIVDALIDRFNMEKRLEPEKIEEKSFQIIAEEAKLDNTPLAQLPIIVRVIHATADFELGKSLLFHPEAIQKAKELIKAGKDILVDVEMLKAGISEKQLKKFGSKVLCYINDLEIAQLSQQTGMTRSELAIEKGITENNVGIVAIGNAPTALLKSIDILKHKEAAKEMVCIGVPVGFVKALESKLILSAQSFPFITNLSRKGGSPVAAAIINSLIKTCLKESI